MKEGEGERERVCENEGRRKEDEMRREGERGRVREERVQDSGRE